MKKTLFALPTCALLLAGPGAAGALAQPEPLQARYGGGSLALTAGGAGEVARLAFPAGGELAFALPEKAELASLAAVDGGWALAGSFLDGDGRRRLFLLAGDEDAARPLPAPAAQRGLARVGPVLLAEGGRLAGVAWLEGDGHQELAVKASRWAGGAWTVPETVAAPGPGSQLALAGTVLADGSWLLLWSAFDGTDDEIVWTRRVGEIWLPARRLAADNAVPDITPAVLPLGTGAVAAWSRYDGNDYRLMLARFTADGWSDARPSGGPGSLYPRFVEGEGAPRLLHYSARPAGWTVLELDRGGAVARRAEVASGRRGRPLLLEGGDDGRDVRLVWPGAAARRAPLREVER